MLDNIGISCYYKVSNSFTLNKYTTNKVEATAKNENKRKKNHS